MKIIKRIGNWFGRIFDDFTLVFFLVLGSLSFYVACMQYAKGNEMIAFLQAVNAITFIVITIHYTQESTIIKWVKRMHRICITRHPILVLKS